MTVPIGPKRQRYVCGESQAGMLQLFGCGTFLYASRGVEADDPATPVATLHRDRAARSLIDPYKYFSRMKKNPAAGRARVQKKDRGGGAAMQELVSRHIILCS